MDIFLLDMMFKNKIVTFYLKYFKFYRPKYPKYFIITKDRTY